MAQHVDADRVRRLRVLADRAGAQAPAGPEQPDVDRDDQDVGEVDDHGGVEQQRPDHRDAAEQGELDVVEQRRGVEGGRVRLHEGVVEEAGQAGGEHVEHHAQDDLVDQVADREHGEHAADQGAGERAGQHARSRPDHGADQGGRPGAGQHLALDRDVDDTRALAHHTAQGAEDQRDGEADGAGQQADDVERDVVAARRGEPADQGDHEECDRAAHDQPEPTSPRSDEPPHAQEQDDDAGHPRDRDRREREAWHVRGTGRAQLDRGSVVVVAREPEAPHGQQPERDQRQAGSQPLRLRDRRAGDDLLDDELVGWSERWWLIRSTPSRAVHRPRWRVPSAGTPRGSASAPR